MSRRRKKPSGCARCLWCIALLAVVSLVWQLVEATVGGVKATADIVQAAEFRAKLISAVTYVSLAVAGAGVAAFVGVGVVRAIAAYQRACRVYGPRRAMGVAFASLWGVAAFIAVVYFCIHPSAIFALCGVSALAASLILVAFAAPPDGQRRIVRQVRRRLPPKIRQVLRAEPEIVAELEELDWKEFEEFLADFFEQLGFLVEPVGRTGDEGADLILTHNTFRIAVQAKHYKRNKVSRKAVGEVLMGKSCYRCNTAVVVTTGRFTKDARDTASKTGCILIDGAQLQALRCGKLSLHVGDSKFTLATSSTS